jgi:hypothetical protein
MELQWKDYKAFEDSDCFNQIYCEGFNDAGLMAKVAAETYDSTKLEGMDEYTLLEPELVYDIFFGSEDFFKIVVAEAIDYKQHYRDLYDEWIIEYEEHISNMFIEIDSIGGNKQ